MKELITLEQYYQGNLKLIRHAKNVLGIAEKIIEQYKQNVISDVLGNEYQFDAIRISSYLHDVGKTKHAGNHEIQGMKLFVQNIWLDIAEEYENNEKVMTSISSAIGNHKDTKLRYKSDLMGVSMVVFASDKISHMRDTKSHAEWEKYKKKITKMIKNSKTITVCDEELELWARCIEEVLENERCG